MDKENQKLLLSMKKDECNYPDPLYLESYMDERIRLIESGWTAIDHDVEEKDEDEDESVDMESDLESEEEEEEDKEEEEEEDKEEGEEEDKEEDKEEEEEDKKEEEEDKKEEEEEDKEEEEEDTTVMWSHYSIGSIHKVKILSIKEYGYICNLVEDEENSITCLAQGAINTDNCKGKENSEVECAILDINTDLQIIYITLNMNYIKNLKSLRVDSIQEISAINYNDV